MEIGNVKDSDNHKNNYKEDNRFMDLFILKIIGVVTMFIDHYHFIIGGPKILDVIGRLAFPIFSFSLSEGYTYTRNLKKYMGRLLIFALIFQIPSIIFKLNYPINIFFTLFFGLLAVSIRHLKNTHILIKIILISLILYTAQKYEFDYGAYGILLIILFNIFREKKILIFTGFTALNLIILLNPGIFQLSSTQIYSQLSLIPIFLYNGKKGRNLKYFFYLFYPIHFFILEAINR